MKIDTHVHTSKFSPCSYLGPEDLVQAAQRRGLDGIVITDHNAIYTDQEWSALKQEVGDLLILRGVEITGADTLHYLCYGPVWELPLFEGMDPRELVPLVQGAGGFVALAHPYRYHDHLPTYIPEIGLDAIEIKSNNMNPKNRERSLELQQSLGVGAIAGSDGHILDAVGMYGVEFAQGIKDEESLVKALRSGEYRIF